MNKCLAGIKDEVSADDADPSVENDWLAHCFVAMVAYGLALSSSQAHR